MVWTNRIRFLFGSFKYQDQGMFDFGHIRWFTYAYLKEVLAERAVELLKDGIDTTESLKAIELFGEYAQING